MSRPQYIISHDVGTSSNKAVLIGLDGKIKAYCTQGYPIHYPQVNWAEQDPEDYWNAVCHTTKKVMQQGDVSSSDIAGVIFTTQTIGIIPMDGNKRCLRPAIIWMDGRASKQADQIMSKFGGRGIFSNIVGTAITGKDGLAKLLWIKQNEPDVYKKTEYFLDVNGYLTFKMTGRQVYEWSCASTIGFDLKKNDWMRGIIRYIGLDLNKFPELVRSTDRVGGITREAAEQCGLLEGIPV
ncbi:MAG: FGGY family carbohydrate kinase, partial [Clostridia bacterium]|nr:FGGY family carbohydrate kinase [Clostridia bacterium]